MTTDVPIGVAGARILLATPNFANYTDVPLTPDFIMDPIPASYLAAGQVRFTNDAGNSQYWLLSWGNYSGLQTGTTDNDFDGNFSPPVDGPLPSTSLQALRFTRSIAANALSITNQGDYTLTSGPSAWINNAGASATLVAPPTGLPGDFNDDDVVDAADYVVWRKNLGTNVDLSGNGDETGASAGVVDQADFELWRGKFGDTPGSGSGVTAGVPEPASALSLAMAWLFFGSMPRRSGFNRQ
jgi:hypothetical protein